MLTCFLTASADTKSVVKATNLISYK
jgi:hypothetical protein